MKAAVINEFGSSKVFTLINDYPKPEPGDNEILVKVHASSINPIDYKQRKGNHKFILGSKFPIVLGYDIAGVVEETGQNVSYFKKGDRVFGRSDRKYGGALAEYVTSNENCFAKLHKDIDIKKAAAFPLAASTALQGLRDKGKVQEGKKVLIIGATGGVGHFAIQIARILKTHVTAVCGNGHDNIINKIKPNKLIQYTQPGYKNSLEKYDIVFDIAGKESFRTMHKFLEKDGVYISTLPRPKILAHKLLAFIKMKKVKTLLMKANRNDLEILQNWILEKKLNTHITSEFPIESVADAHLLAEQGHTEGKIVISII